MESTRISIDSSDSYDESPRDFHAPLVMSTVRRASYSTEPVRTRRRKSAHNPFAVTKGERTVNKTGLRIRRNEGWGRVTEKWWLNAKATREDRIGYWLVWAGVALGFLCACGFAVWGYFDGFQPPTCTFIKENFNYEGIDGNTWRHEVSSGGWHQGGFEWNTDSSENSFIKNGQLHIRPTLTKSYPDGTNINLTTDGGCTDPYYWCSMSQNSTNHTSINPVQSAKISTKMNMTFGTVEVRAKMPKGDWIWAAISLNPADTYYGVYPANGQLVLAQTRGNKRGYPQGGRERVDSFLQVGLDAQQGLSRSYGSQMIRKFDDYSDGFHTFGIQWNRWSIRTYIDDPTNTVMLVEPWKMQGYFVGLHLDQWVYWPGAYDNLATSYPDMSAPFNRDFYLTLQVGVGGMNGIFDVDQPWTLTNGRDYALNQFAQNIQNNTANWPEGDDRDLIIDSVTMRKQCHVTPYKKHPSKGGLGYQGSLLSGLGIW
ncbi:hypothetical protein PYCC9005_004092 [Savitreella phatthalungensis]